MEPPDQEKDRPARPSSDSVIVHIVDEMPVRVVLAVTFVAFFFVWGAVNNLLKLTGRSAADFDNSPGIYAGFFAAIATPFVIWRIKHRTK